MSYRSDAQGEPKSTPHGPCDSTYTGSRLSGPDDEISPLVVINVLLRYRWTIVQWTAGVTLLAVALALLSPRRYMADASFLPQEGESSALAGAAALASQFGVSLPGGDIGRSPQFYADLLLSRELLMPILQDTVTITESKWGSAAETTAPLLSILEIEEETEALRRKRAIEWLQSEAVAVASDVETGLVRLEVTSPWPTVSWQIAARLLDLMNEFNLEQRRTQAQAERSFIEERLAEAQEELREAEEGLETFLENNRAFQNSPDLQFQYDRLQRQVAMRQTIFTSLSQSYEEARILEVRNTPVITVVEQPVVPPEHEPRRRVLIVIFGLFVGLFLGTLAAFVRELFSSWKREGDEEYREFESLRRETLLDIRHPMNRISDFD